MNIKINNKFLDDFIKESSSKSVVVTLYEGHYHFGVAALINSLEKSNFNGLIQIGFRGNLPNWTLGLEKIDTTLFKLNSTILINFLPVNSDIHFGYYKPNFMKDVLLDFESVEKVYYFDPDIVVYAPWSFYLDWTNSGVALCLDNCFPFLHSNHPWRRSWRLLVEDSSGQNHEINYYVNCGFIGLAREEAKILDEWIFLTKRYQKMGGNVKSFDKEGHLSFKGDQDLLNAAITLNNNLNLSIIGTEGMGFTHPAYLMVHAVGDIKPWRENFLKSMIYKGRKPTFGAKSYFQFCDGPIKAYSQLKLLRIKIAMKIAMVLGRLIG
jgi:hypothetical protein